MVLNTTVWSVFHPRRPIRYVPHEEGPPPRGWVPLHRSLAYCQGGYWAKQVGPRGDRSAVLFARPAPHVAQSPKGPSQHRFYRSRWSDTAPRLPTRYVCHVALGPHGTRLLPGVLGKAGWPTRGPLHSAFPVQPHTSPPSKGPASIGFYRFSVGRHGSARSPSPSLYAKSQGTGQTTRSRGTEARCFSPRPTRSPPKGSGQQVCRFRWMGVLRLVRSPPY